LRKQKYKYYHEIAKKVAERGTCRRRNFGAVIVANDEIIATGYTGSPRRTDNCLDIGFCLREHMNIPSGQRYDLCRSVHAEQNAIISAARRDMVGATMYVAGISYDGVEVNSKPCYLCQRYILNSGIDLVWFMFDGVMKSITAEELRIENKQEVNKLLYEYKN